VPLISYIKTTWLNKIPGVQSGTKVNATNMNKIEQGLFDVTEAAKTLETQSTGSVIYAYKNIGGAL
jgi:hypothetical protein